MYIHLTLPHNLYVLLLVGFKIDCMYPRRRRRRGVSFPSPTNDVFGRLTVGKIDINCLSYQSRCCYIPEVPTVITVSGMRRTKVDTSPILSSPSPVRSPSLGSWKYQAGERREFAVFRLAPKSGRIAHFRPIRLIPLPGSGSHFQPAQETQCP
jgi:hypothetical protein